MPDDRDRAEDAAQAGTLPAPDAGEAGTLPGRAPPPAAMGPFQLGARVGDRYQLRRLLGQGGMGAVFLAFDEMLGKEVALKTLRTDGVGSASQLAGLRDEVLLAQKVTHGNVCRTYDLSVVDGVHVVKMEYVDSETLAEVLAVRGRFSVDETIAMTRQILAGLAAAHAQGVVHRDLKPQNVLVERGTGRALIMDFGLARLDASEVEGLSGTPEYLAPEQARGLPVDARTDLYALGCVVYQLLVGQVPFTAPTRMGVVERHLVDPPPSPRAARPEVPPWLSALVLSLLAKDPAQRPQSAAAVLAALDAPSLRRRRRNRIALSLGLLAASGAVAMLAPRRAEWRANVRAVLPSYEENSSGPQLSPDGARLAYDSTRDGSWRLYVGPIEGTGARAVTPAGFEAQYPRWSHDGRALLFRHDLDVYRVAIDDGAPILLAKDAHVAADCDGRAAIAYTGTATCPGCYRIALRDADGSERELVRLPPDTWFGGPIACEPHAGVAYAVAPRTFQGDQQPSDLWLAPLDGGAPRRLTDDHLGNAEPAFTPQGRSIVFRSRAGGAINLWEIGTSGGRARRLTFGAGPDVGPSVAPDGRSVLYDNDVTTLPVYVRSLEDGRQRRVTQAQVDVAQPIVVGRELVAVVTRAGRDEVVALPLDGGDERALGEGSAVAVGRDGRTLYVARRRDGRWQLDALRVAGGASRAIGALPGRPRAIAADADDALHVVIDSGAGDEAWRVRLADGASAREPRYVSRPSRADASWQAVLRVGPRGSYLAELTPIEGARPAVELAFDMFTWSRDGRALVYARGNEIRRRELGSGRDERLFEVPDLADNGLAVSDDGKSVYFVAGVGRVQRQILTNFAERPALPKATP